MISGSEIPVNTEELVNTIQKLISNYKIFVDSFESSYNQGESHAQFISKGKAKNQAYDAVCEQMKILQTIVRANKSNIELKNTLNTLNTELKTHSGRSQEVIKKYKEKSIQKTVQSDKKVEQSHANEPSKAPIQSAANVNPKPDQIPETKEQHKERINRLINKCKELEPPEILTSFQLLPDDKSIQSIKDEVIQRTKTFQNSEPHTSIKTFLWFLVYGMSEINKWYESNHKVNPENQINEFPIEAYAQFVERCHKSILTLDYVSNQQEEIYPDNVPKREKNNDTFDNLLIYLLTQLYDSDFKFSILLMRVRRSRNGSLSEIITKFDFLRKDFPAHYNNIISESKKLLTSDGAARISPYMSLLSQTIKDANITDNGILTLQEKLLKISKLQEEEIHHTNETSSTWKNLIDQTIANANPSITKVQEVFFEALNSATEARDKIIKNFNESSKDHNSLLEGNTGAEYKSLIDIFDQLVMQVKQASDKLDTIKNTIYHVEDNEIRLDAFFIKKYPQETNALRKALTTMKMQDDYPIILELSQKIIVLFDDFIKNNQLLYQKIKAVETKKLTDIFQNVAGSNAPQRLYQPANLQNRIPPVPERKNPENPPKKSPCCNIQ